MGARRKTDNSRPTNGCGSEKPSRVGAERSRGDREKTTREETGKRSEEEAEGKEEIERRERTGKKGKRRRKEHMLDEWNLNRGLIASLSG